MKFWLLTCLLLLGTLGCASQPIVLYLDNATAVERSATEVAVARLNPYARPERAIVIVPSGTAPRSGDYTLSFVDRIPTKDGDMLGRECTKEGTDCPRARSIRVLRTMPADLASAVPDLLVRVLAHEIGHAWQLPHLTPRAMMSLGSWVASPFFTTIDQAVCVEKGECAEVPAAPPPLPLDPPGAAKAMNDRRID